MLFGNEDKMKVMGAGIWLQQHRAAIRNLVVLHSEASWLIHGEGERILQRDYEQVFLSINAFALKHVSLFKEEHSMCLDRKRCICKTCINFAQIFSCC